MSTTSYVGPISRPTAVIFIPISRLIDLSRDATPQVAAASLIGKANGLRGDLYFTYARPNHSPGSPIFTFPNSNHHHALPCVTTVRRRPLMINPSVFSLIHTQITPFPQIPSSPKSRAPLIYRTAENDKLHRRRRGRRCIAYNLREKGLQHCDFYRLH